MDVKHIAVIGAGVMGSGVAQVSACAGYTVVMQDVSDQALTKAQGCNYIQSGEIDGKRQTHPASRRIPPWGTSPL